VVVGLKSFRGLEACNLVTTIISSSSSILQWNLDAIQGKTILYNNIMLDGVHCLWYRHV
jgi:hypothetical protein